MKLVITGHDSSGRSVFSYAGAPREPAPGIFDLWSTGGTVRVPDATETADFGGVNGFPGPGETAFKIATVPKRSKREGQTDSDADPEVSRFYEREDPAMHTTDTVDYAIVLSGAADLELDDGAVERVEAGDVVVQRGTRHAWRQLGDEPFVLAVVMLGAQRSTSSR